MSFEQQKSELVSICKSLLDEGRVKLILGFAPGEIPGKAVPYFVRTREEVERMIWNDTCTPNLAKYLIEKSDKVAVIAKPCDARAIVMYMAENQIERDKIFIIGLECEGMRNIDGSCDSICSDCKVRVPPLFDILIKDDSKAAYTFEACSPTVSEEEGIDKFARFKKEIRKCILCFSCRQACYGCYCGSCFMERDVHGLGWLPSQLDEGAKMMFHLGRAMHMAGRCVECGACERACPSGVKIHYLIKELTEFCKENYGYHPGINPGEIPAMSAYCQDDRETGFLEK